MTIRTQKITAQVLFSSATLFGWEALVYVLNLNQSQIYLRLAGYFAAFLVLKLIFFYDLHFKARPGLICPHQSHENFLLRLECEARLLGDFLRERFTHFFRWRYLRHLMRYLPLPALVFFPTVILIYINLGRQTLQQAVVLGSTLGLSANYWFVKDAFHKKDEFLSHTAFLYLQMVKLYAAFLIFTALLGLWHWFCLPLWGLYVASFFGAFLLIYQAIFQFKAITRVDFGYTLVIAGAMSASTGLAYFYWGFNYVTAGLFLMSLYNFFWGTFAYAVRRRLTWRIFLEYLVVTLFVCVVALLLTNFRAQILPACAATLTGGG